MRAIRITLTALIFSAAACSSTSSVPTAQEARKTALKSPEARTKLIDNLKIGDSRAAVEKVLGRPMSITQTAEGTSAMYMFGFDMSELMAAAQPSTASTVGHSVLGMAGALGGPIGGIGASIGSQALSMGSEIGAARAMPDMKQIEMVNISYRDNKVFSIQRQTPGAMGGATEAESEDGPSMQPAE